MASPNHALPAGPADSRLVRMLLYTGEGAMLGGVCYYTIHLLFSTLTGVDP